MLTLLSFPPGLGNPSLSPFCLKAMCLLDMAGKDWRPEFYMTPEAGPLGKLPALRTPGGVIPDSNLILKWLTGQGADLFSGLDVKARAQAHALIRLVEENLCLGLVHDRWLDDANWAITGPLFFAEVPAPARAEVAEDMRQKVRAGLTGQGMGRFSEAQRMDYMDADLDALQGQLGSSRFLFGDLPCAADAAVLAVLASIDSLPKDTALRRGLRWRTPLMRYLESGRERLFPDVSGWTSAAA